MNKIITLKGRDGMSCVDLYRCTNKMLKDADIQSWYHLMDGSKPCNSGKKIQLRD